MTTGNAMADIRAMFTKQFPQLTKGKDRSEVKEIMKEMGYGMNTGLNKTMRKSGGKSNFKDGGDVPMPKRRPKNFKKTVEKQKKERAVAKGKVTVGGLNEMTDYDKEQFLKSKKMKLGGEAKPLVGNQFKLDKNKNGRIDGGDFAKMEVGGEALVTPIMKGKRISEKRKKLLLRREKEEMKKDIPVKKMEMGGKVKEYGGGGKVKGGKMTCRGMGAAVKGGGFSIS